jgi:hypothetical protein
MACKYFFPNMWLVFSFLKEDLWWNKCFILIKSNLPVFALMDYTFERKSKNSLAVPKNPRIFSQKKNFLLYT